MVTKQLEGTWSSRFTFIMAAVGSAVGLGNFWRFPYMAGENGGGAFVVVYLVAVAFIAVPVLMSEYSIGRYTKMAASYATGKIAQDSGGGGVWGLVGGIGMLAGFLILSFYSVIAGWVMAYVPMFASGEIVGKSYAEAGEIFGALTADPTRVIMWHAAFMGITVLIVARGLAGGIELAANILMPLFFVMLIAMVIYSLVEGDSAAAYNYLFSVDFSKITPDVIVSAIGQAFFSVGVASAIMISYGAYLNQTTNIGSSAYIVAAADTGVAMLAGFAIFPLVFAQGLDTAAGPGLLFVTMPAAMAQLPLAQFVGTAFFTLAFFAALTSSISLLEVAVGWGKERTNLPRWMSAVIAGLICWLVGLGTVYSFSSWAEYYPINFGIFAELNFFGIVDKLTDSILLPLGGLLLALLAGWVVKPQIMREQTGLGSLSFLIWQILMRFIIPVFILIVLLWAHLPSSVLDKIRSITGG